MGEQNRPLTGLESPAHQIIIQLFPIGGKGQGPGVPGPWKINFPKAQKVIWGLSRFRQKIWSVVTVKPEGRFVNLKGSGAAASWGCGSPGLFRGT
ncbi:MAG: hypothetical protein LBR11_13250 [Deltaproteobacteria bacterium]|nr:hypothetical protein [Deltaproteobacteria bacterium]